MKVYLAARYSRRLELCDFREHLQRIGYTVTSRWLDGDHQISDNGTPIGESGEALIEGDDGSDSIAAQTLRSEFAQEDLADIDHADIFIAFTEPPRSSASRGGRHVELGYAIAMNMTIYVVGYRENLFCWLPDVHFWENKRDLFVHLQNRIAEAAS